MTEKEWLWVARMLVQYGRHLDGCWFQKWETPKAKRCTCGFRDALNTARSEAGLVPEKRGTP